MAVDKLIEKMKNQPNGIRFDELRRNPNTGYSLSVPRQNPMKATYVADVLELIGEQIPLLL